MSQILLALVALANLIITVTRAAASALRINEVFARQPGMQEGTDTLSVSADTEEMVRFEEVSFTYQGAREPALENISFTAKRGETIGIIGGTGSGKSTLVSLIPRFYDGDSGQVLVAGKPVQQYAFDSLRKKIGIVPQRAVLFAGTIRENMRWQKEDASEEEIWQALATAQAREVVEGKKGRGLDGQVTAGGRNFSGGQRQRLTIARAPVSRPEILILDDSASALDFATDAALRGEH